MIKATASVCLHYLSCILKLWIISDILLVILSDSWIVYVFLIVLSNYYSRLNHIQIKFNILYVYCDYKCIISAVHSLPPQQSLPVRDSNSQTLGFEAWIYYVLINCFIFLG